MPSGNTKEDILDAAEFLFGENGIGATSLRSIVARADVNVAAIHYHFGSKDELVQEVFRRRLRMVNERREANLDDLEEVHGASAIPVEELFRAFLEPALQLAHDQASGGSQFMRLVGRAHSETDAAVQEVMLRELSPVVERFLQSMARSVPGLEEKQRRLRLLFSAGAMVQLMLLPEKERFLHFVFGEAFDLAGALSELVQFCSAGMSSVSSADEVTS